MWDCCWDRRTCGLSLICRRLYTTLNKQPAPPRYINWTWAIKVRPARGVIRWPLADIGVYCVHPQPALIVWNDIEWGFRPPLCAYRGQDNFPGMVRWHCPSDTGHRIRFIVWALSGQSLWRLDLWSLWPCFTTISTTQALTATNRPVTVKAYNCPVSTVSSSSTIYALR